MLTQFFEFFHYDKITSGLETTRYKNPRPYEAKLSLSWDIHYACCI